MRTNIVIDDGLMAAAMKIAGTNTKRATVELALRELVSSERRASIVSLAGELDIAPIEEIRPPDQSRRWSS